MRMLGITLAILILIMAVLTFAIYNLDSLINKKKGYILSKVEESTGRKANVENIGLNIFGGIGIQLSNFKLSDNPEFSSKNFISASDLVISVEFLPLLKKELVVKRIILNDPRINIIKNQNGIYNFDSIINKEDKKQEKNKERTSKGRMGELSIAVIDISNGNISYRDMQNNTNIDLDDVDLRSRNIGTKKPVKFDLSMALLSEKQNINFEGEAGPFGDNYSFNDLPVKGKLAITSLNIDDLKKSYAELSEILPQGIGLSGPFDANIEFSGKTTELDVNSFDVNACLFNSGEKNLSAKGSLEPVNVLNPSMDKSTISVEFKLGPVPFEQLKNIKLIKSSFPPELKGSGPVSASGTMNGKLNDLSFRSIELNAVGTDLEYGEKFTKPKGTEFMLTADADMSGNKVLIRKSELVLGGLTVSARGNVNTGENIGLDLSISSNKAELSGLSQLFKSVAEYKPSGLFKINTDVRGEYGKNKFPDINGDTKLENVSISLPQLAKPISEINGVVNFTGEKAVIKKTSAMMGNSRILFSANVESFSPLSLNYSVTSAAVNLSDLSAESKGTIKNLDMQGNMSMKGDSTSVDTVIKSDSGKISGIGYSDLDGKINMKNNVVNFNELVFKSLNGYMKTSGYYDMSSDIPKFNFNTSVKGLNITNLLRAFLSTESDHIKGVTDLSLNISGRGNSWDQIKNTLNGLGNIQLTEGELVDFNMAEEVLNGLTGIQGLSGLISSELEKKYPGIFKTTSTVFYNLNTPVKIVDGKINFDDLLLKSSEYIVKGKGTIGLNKKIDANGYITLAENISKDLASRVELIKYLNDENGMVRIPFRMDGSIPVVKPSPDLTFISQTLKNAAFEKGKQEIKKKLMENIAPENKDSQDTQQKTTQDIEKNVKEKIKKLIPFNTGVPGKKNEKSGMQNSGNEVPEQ